MLEVELIGGVYDENQYFLLLPISHKVVSNRIKLYIQRLNAASKMVHEMFQYRPPGPPLA